MIERVQIPFPSIGRPALRALNAAGYEHLGQLDGARMRDVLALHGMGQKGIGALRRAMTGHGWSFADDDPTVGAVRGGLVRVEDGRQPERNANATKPSELLPAEWIAALPKQRQRDDGQAMLAMFDEITGAPAVMWGPSIVGYGQLHYTYESGREGDTARVGFSPRSASNTIYGLTGHDGADELLARLGKHRLGAGCLYINKLADADLDVLRELVALGWRQETAQLGHDASVSAGNT